MAGGLICRPSVNWSSVNHAIVVVAAVAGVDAENLAAVAVVEGGRVHCKSGAHYSYDLICRLFVVRRLLRRQRRQSSSHSATSGGRWVRSATLKRRSRCRKTASRGSSANRRPRVESRDLFPVKPFLGELFQFSIVPEAVFAPLFSAWSPLLLFLSSSSTLMTLKSLTFCRGRSQFCFPRSPKMSPLSPGHRNISSTRPNKPKRAQTTKSGSRNSNCFGLFSTKTDFHP